MVGCAIFYLGKLELKTISCQQQNIVLSLKIKIKRYFKFKRNNKSIAFPIGH